MFFIITFTSQPNYKKQEVSPLTLLEPQSHFGDNQFKFQVVCPQIGTAVLKGLIDLLEKQAVVTGVVPSPLPPRYVPSFISCIGFSIPTDRRFSSNVANSRSHASRDFFFMQGKVLVIGVCVCSSH